MASEMERVARFAKILVCSAVFIGGAYFAFVYLLATR